MTVESHRQHGTHVKYVIDRCKCDPCREANNRYERGRRSRIEPPYVSATAARAHVLELRAAGVGLKTVAEQAGVSHGALSKLIYGQQGRAPSKRIRRTTHERILAVTPAAARGTAKVDATTTKAQLADMIAAGIPKSTIAAALGAKGPGLQVANRPQVAAKTARKVAELHTRWMAGTWTPVRRDSWGNTTPIATPVTVRQPGADITDLLLDLAEIVELRNDQADWRAIAACRNRPTHMWFPQRGDQEMTAAALRICGACMVRDQCRAATFDERDGVYGGLSAGARRRIRQQDTAA